MAGMKKQRKAIVRRVYDVLRAEILEDTLQQYLDEDWEIESINHAGESFCIILSKNSEEV